MSCTKIHVESTVMEIFEKMWRLKWWKRAKIEPNQCEMVWFVIDHKVVTGEKVDFWANAAFQNIYMSIIKGNDTTG